MIAEVHVINLAASTDRWRTIQPIVRAMRLPAPIRFPALDGRALGEAGLAALQREGRLSTDLKGFDPHCREGEIGCVLSHIGVLTDIVQRQVPSALILEDDILLAGPAWSWPARFRRAYADLPADWELWFLYRCLDIEHRIQRLTRRTVVPWTPQGGAAYAVTLAGARKLLAALTPAASAVDRVYQALVQKRQVRAFAASPLLILPGRHPSIINRDDSPREWVENGINRPPEFWPRTHLAHLGEVAPPDPWWRQARRALWR